MHQSYFLGHYYETETETKTKTVVMCGRGETEQERMNLFPILSAPRCLVGGLGPVQAVPRRFQLCPTISATCII